MVCETRQSKRRTNWLIILFNLWHFLELQLSCLHFSCFVHANSCSYLLCHWKSTDFFFRGIHISTSVIHKFIENRLVFIQICFSALVLVAKWCNLLRIFCRHNRSDMTRQNNKLPKKKKNSHNQVFSLIFSIRRQSRSLTNVASLVFGEFLVRTWRIRYKVKRRKKKHFKWQITNECSHPIVGAVVVVVIKFDFKKNNNNNKKRRKKIHFVFILLSPFRLTAWFR